MIQCPKCEYEQPERSECIRCGIVYSKFRAAAVDPAAETGEEDDEKPKWGGVWVPPEEEAKPATAGTWVFRIVSLLLIVGLVAVWQTSQSARNAEPYVVLERFVQQDRTVFTDLVGRLGDVEVARFFDATIDEEGGTASFTLPLTGRKGEGSVQAVLRRGRGVWDIERAVYTDRTGLKHSLVAAEAVVAAQRGAVVQTPWDSAAAPVAPAARSGPDAFASWLRGAPGYAKAQQLVASTPRPMVVYFHSSHCRYSVAFEEQVLPHPALASILSGVLHVEIDPTSGDGERTVAEQYGVTGFPTFVLVGPGGGSKVIPAFYETGPVTADDFGREVRRAQARL